MSNSQSAKFFRLLFAITLLPVAHLACLRAAGVPLDATSSPGSSTITAGNSFRMTPQVTAKGTVLSAAAVSNDGEIVALGDEQGELLLVSISRRQLLNRTHVHSGKLESLFIRPDGRTLLSVGADDRACEVKIPTGDVAFCFAIDPGRFSNAMFISMMMSNGDGTHPAASPHGKALLSALSRSEEIGYNLAIYGADYAVSGITTRPPTEAQRRETETLRRTMRPELLEISSKYPRFRFGLCFWDLHQARPQCRFVETEDGSAVALGPSEALLTDCNEISWIPVDGVSPISKVAIPKGPPDYSGWSFNDLNVETSREGQSSVACSIESLAHGDALSLSHGTARFVRGHGHFLDRDVDAEVIGAAQNGLLGVSATAKALGIFLHVWDQKKGTITSFVSIRSSTTDRVAAISDRVALVAADDRLWAFDWSTAVALPILHVSGEIMSMSPDGRMVLALEGGKIYPWDVAKGRSFDALPPPWAALPSKNSLTEDWFQRFRPQITCGVPGLSNANQGCKALVDGCSLYDPVTGDLDATLCEGSGCGHPDPSSLIVCSAGMDAFHLLSTLSGDGRRSARGGGFQSIEIFNTTNASMIGTIRLSSGEPSSIALDRNGERLLVAENHHFEQSSLLGRARNTHNITLYAVATGRVISSVEVDAGVREVAISDDGCVGTYVTYRNPNELNVIHFDTGRVDPPLRGHAGAIREMSISPDRKHAVTAAEDGTARIWSLESGNSVGLVVWAEDWLAYTDDGYFESSRHGEHLVASSLGGRPFPLEDTAVWNNRPDKLIESLASNISPRSPPASSSAAQYFASRHADRLTQIGLKDADRYTATLDSMPRASIPKVEQAGKFADVSLELTATKGSLSSYNIFDNGVAIDGPSGTPIEGTSARLTRRIELTGKVNKIEVSVRAKNGMRARSDPYIANYDGTVSKRIFYVGFGTSGNGVRYAHDDAVALGEILRQPGGPLPYVPDTVSMSSIDGARELLKEAGVDDTVVMLVSGHGVHLRGRESGLVVFTSGSDPSRPKTWTPISVFENMLDGVAARARLLLVDTCEAGTDSDMPPTTVETSPFGGLSADLGLQDRYVLNDITRSSSTVVFSAARGYERSAEDTNAHHGYFAGTVIEALLGDADNSPRNGMVSLSELSDYVSTHVTRRNRGQHPTLDRDPRLGDFSLPVASKVGQPDVR